MGIYKEVYDFAAKAGSLEGYVYPRESVDVSYLPRWSDNLVEQYWGLALAVREEFQSLCDQTLGRTIQSLLPILGGDHEVIKELKGLVIGRLPSSPDDFPHRKKKGGSSQLCRTSTRVARSLLIGCICPR